MKKFIIIDGNAIVHRAFHALPDFKSKKGESVGALYGFISFFLKAIKDNKPDFVAVTFDMEGPTFRNKEYSLYKAKRKKAPDNLYSQIPKIKDFLKGIGVSFFEKKGFEADDIIGTISNNVSKSFEVIIITGDMDAFQLIENNIKVFLLERGIKKGSLYDSEKIKEKFDGLYPEDLIEFKALRGDPSDNIPGVFGIGEKTAIELIKRYSNIENIYQKIEEIDNNFKKSVKEKLEKNKSQAFLSRKLVRIRKDIKMSFNINSCAFKEDKEKFVKFFDKYGFKSLSSRILEEKKVNMTLF